MDGVDFEEECYFLDGISQFCGDSSPEVADNAESNIDRNRIRIGIYGYVYPRSRVLYAI